MNNTTAYDPAEAIHWLTLRLSLPPEGVRKRFPTAASCQQRLIAARWPDGVRCQRCDTAVPVRVKTRGLMQCRSCKFQMSATAGSALHRSRVALPLWFRTAELIIWYRDTSGLWGHIPAQPLGEEIKVAYLTARRIRQIVLDDVRPGGTGLLRAAVCTEEVIPPVDIRKGTEAHLRWLLSL